MQKLKKHFLYGYTVACNMNYVLCKDFICGRDFQVWILSYSIYQMLVFDNIKIKASCRYMGFKSRFHLHSFFSNLHTQVVSDLININKQTQKLFNSRYQIWKICVYLKCVFNISNQRMQQCSKEIFLKIIYMQIEKIYFQTLSWQILKTRFGLKFFR